MSIPSEAPRVKEKRKSHVRNEIVTNKYIHFNCMEPKFFSKGNICYGTSPPKKSDNHWTFQLRGK